MYALIEDDYDPTKREKQVMSAHKSREAAQKALLCVLMFCNTIVYQPS